MDEQYQSPEQHPQEHHSYGNGSTKPPKSRGGLIALILGIGIFLLGIVSTNGILPFLPSLLPTAPSGAVSFLSSEPSEIPTEATYETVPVPTNNTQLQLQPAPDNVDNIPQAGGLGFQEIYSKNIPSVVSILCDLENGSASGTGVVLSKNGYLVTNAHVIEDAVQIHALLTDGRTFPARLIGSDKVSDLAVLYISADDLTPATFGDSTKLRVGDAVAAIGDPLGVELRGTMTNGIVSAINRDLYTNGRTMTLIQTNAALNSGNSGGPLINCYGQVIGINTMKIGTFSDEAGVEGLGFAIPSVTVKEIVDQLITQGYVSGRPVLPLTGEWVSAFHQQFRHIPAGLYITRSLENTPIQARDILLQVDNVRVTNEDELHVVLNSHNAGDTVTLVLYRAGMQYTTSITLAEAGS